MGNNQKLNDINFDRRSFLAASSLAAIGSALEVAAEPSHQPRTGDLPERRQVSPSLPASRVEGVNLLQGTDSTQFFSQGNTLPIAALPFGMAHWTLQSQSNTPWMFQPGDRRIQGFRCTHQLSPWLSDYGQAIFLPFSGDVNPQAEARASSYRPEEAKLLPCSLRLYLMRYRASVELIPTERCAVLTATFDGAGPRGFLFEIPGSAGLIRRDDANHAVYFDSSINEGGVPNNFATYYVLRFAEAWDSFEVQEVQGSRIGIVRFSQGTSKPLEARIATSFVSFEQADLNFHREVGTTPTAMLRARAAARWNEHLGRIDVEGGFYQHQNIFYSCFYRALLFPRTWYELDADGNPQHFSPYNGKVLPGVMYADHGYWDVYRAWYPLMAIVFPERLSEILQAWVNAYKEGGWLPQFPCPGYRACMTGSLIDSVFGDAAAKGISNFDLAGAYNGLKKHATHPGDPDRGYGRRGLEYYLRLGYVPADLVHQSVAETADAAYGDFCIAQVAKALGRSEEAAMFLNRSRNWRNLFDPGTGFLRGKKEDGSWLEPFDPFTWGSPYVEGSAWQHRWDVPHDIPALIEALGGNNRAFAALEKMLSSAPIFKVGVYGQEIHEMSEMAAVDFGQYAHSNQPVHHVLYILAMAGRPDRTQYWVRRVMNTLYTQDKFPGDEDTGSMSAWFMFSSMGFYPLCPGRPEYIVGSPLFERVRIHLSEGRTTVIEAHNQKEDAPYVSRLLVNGNRHTSASISHDVIMSGGRLSFLMQTTPGRGVPGNG